MIRRTVRKAFTLVEILIVVVILGILAAIVVPQFTNATQEAQGGNIKAQLSSLNRQIELYRARNNGTLPTAAGDETFWTPLIQGGYIKSAPSNPAFVGGGAAATYVAAAADGTGSNAAGWTLTSADSGTIAGGDFIAANTLLASYFDEVAGAVTATTP